MQGILIILGVILYFWFAQLITWRLMSIPESPGKQRIVCGLCILIAFAIPFGDVVLIKWKFNQLCKSEAGIHVYEQVILGPEFWREDGSLNYPPDRNFEDVMPKEFKVVPDFGGNWAPVTRIRKSRVQIRRKSDQKIIGEGVQIWHGPSWLQRTIMSGGGVKGCPSSMPYESIAEAIFKQQPN